MEWSGRGDASASMRMSLGSAVRMITLGSCGEQAAQHDSSTTGGPRPGTYPLVKLGALREQGVGERRTSVSAAGHCAPTVATVDPRRKHTGTKRPTRPSGPVPRARAPARLPRLPPRPHPSRAARAPSPAAPARAAPRRARGGRARAPACRSPAAPARRAARPARRPAPPGRPRARRGRRPAPARRPPAAPPPSSAAPPPPWPPWRAAHAGGALERF